MKEPEAVGSVAVLESPLADETRCNPDTNTIVGFICSRNSSHNLENCPLYQNVMKQPIEQLPQVLSMIGEGCGLASRIESAVLARIKVSEVLNNIEPVDGDFLEPLKQRVLAMSASR
jgi:hypothetical protein